MTRSWGVQDGEWEKDSGQKAREGVMEKAWLGLGAGLRVYTSHTEALISKCVQAGLEAGPREERGRFKRETNKHGGRCGGGCNNRGGRKAGFKLTRERRLWGKVGGVRRRQT